MDAIGVRVMGMDNRLKIPHMSFESRCIISDGSDCFAVDRGDIRVMQGELPLRQSHEIFDPSFPVGGG